MPSNRPSDRPSNRSESTTPEPKALYDSEEQFRRLVESVTDYAIFLLDADGYVVSWNAGAQRIKGYSAAEILGQHFSRFYTSEDIARGHPEAELQMARHDGRYEEEGWRVRKDGTLFLAHVVIAPLTDAEGQIQGFSKVTRDITEKKQAEQLRLQAEQARLQQESERRNQAFLKQILWIVTEGKLQLCYEEAELPQPLPKQSEPFPLTPQTLRGLRHIIQQKALKQNLPVERTMDLLTAASEAAMNAVVHGGGGVACVNTPVNTPVGTDDADETAEAAEAAEAAAVQVWIEDHGPGIAMDSLHRATLERGFTTAGTLGQGFWMMLQLCDRLWLWTSPAGTTVVLEQTRSAPLPFWLAGLHPPEQGQEQGTESLS